jgi:anti-anti-sigma factor
MLQNPAELGAYRIARPRERTAVVELIGEHDLYTMQKLAPVLESLAAGYDVLVIDLSQIEFMDSTVLKELVRAEHTVSGHNGRLSSAAPCDRRSGRPSRSAGCSTTSTPRRTGKP